MRCLHRRTGHEHRDQAMPSDEHLKREHKTLSFMCKMCAGILLGTSLVGNRLQQIRLKTTKTKRTQGQTQAQRGAAIEPLTQALGLFLALSLSPLLPQRIKGLFRISSFNSRRIPPTLLCLLSFELPQLCTRKGREVDYHACAPANVGGNQKKRNIKERATEKESPGQRHD